MTTGTPMLTAGFWRSRRTAAITGIPFALLLLTATVMLRHALSTESLQSLQSDAQRRTLIRWSLNLVPFAAIAFLWFIGVIREQISRTACSPPCSSAAGPFPDQAVRWRGQRRHLNYGRNSTQALSSVYGMRMEAVFTMSVSTLGLRTFGHAPRSRPPPLPQRIGTAARGRHAGVDPPRLPAGVLMVSVGIPNTRPVHPAH
jgi:hypothetical protein